MGYKRKSPQPIIEGGTNTQSFTNVFGVAYFDGTKLNNIDPGTNGFVLTSQGAAAPIFSPAGAGGVTWNSVITPTVNLVGDNGYIMKNGGTLITATLPTTCAVGQTIIIQGFDTGLWTIAQNAGQTIRFGAIDTTTGTGGSLSSTGKNDAITMVCTATDTDFSIYSSIGSLYYI